MAEEWVKDVQSKARLADNLCIETKKSLVIVEKKNKELAVKLATKDRERKSAEVHLKNTQAQAEE